MPRHAAALLLASAALSCGSPETPLVVPTPSPAPLAAGTSLALVSGRDRAPVREGTVRIGESTYTVGVDGTITLGSTTDIGTRVDVEAPGFLRRRTLLRGTDDVRFVLWPSILDTPEHDEGYTAHLVYTSVAPGAALGSDPLWTLGRDTHRVTIVVTPSLWEYDGHMSDHEAAAAEMNAVLAPDVTYVVSKEPPGAGVVIEARYDEGSPHCVDILAFTRLTLLSDEVTRGEIVYCRPDALSRRVAIHEVGHTMGLRHSIDAFDIMQPYASADPDAQRAGFGEAEALTMRMMRQRRPGNRFPDDDTSLSASAQRTVTILCR